MIPCAPPSAQTLQHDGDASRPGVPCGGDGQKFAVHGLGVELQASVSGLEPFVHRLLSTFAVPGLPPGFAPVHGTVRPYDEAEVMRHLSPAARALPSSHDLADVYQDGERFWMLDDRWGMLEINFLKAQWHSWVLPRPHVDPVRCAERAVLWPLAQLLRPRGLHLLPAVAAARDGWAFLLLCPFGGAPELTTLVRSGYKLIGQRWTAVREEDGRLSLLHVPGMVEHAPKQLGLKPRWADLTEQWPGAWRNHAFCDAVLVAEPGRRPHANIRQVDAASGPALLRRAWPIDELHPSGRHSALPAKLAHLCRLAEVQLSRDPLELLPLLDALRAGRAAAA